MVGEASRLAWLWAKQAALRLAASWYRDLQPIEIKTPKGQNVFICASKGNILKKTLHLVTLNNPELFYKQLFSSVQISGT